MATPAPQLTWGEIAHRLGSFMAETHGEWSGLPLPVDGLTLHVEDRNPWKPKLAVLEQEMAAIERRRTGASDPEPDEHLELVNGWYSKRLRCKVWLVRHADGRVRAHLVDPDISRRSRFVLDTLRVTQVWSLEAEIRAVEKLGELIKEHLWHGYLFSGAFIETSRRSGVTYLFRRCRPTLAIRATDDGSRVLCGLCLHPIGFYSDTFAGSMVPTDEVISHLLLMRGDEALFWRRANQHPPFVPESGL